MTDSTELHHIRRQPPMDGLFATDDIPDYIAAPKVGSQAAVILAALQNGDTLTSLDALKRFNCFRLAAQVWKLRGMGWRIVTETVTTDTGKHIAAYHLG